MIKSLSQKNIDSTIKWIYFEFNYFILWDCNNIALRNRHLIINYTVKVDVYGLIVSVLFFEVLF